MNLNKKEQEAIINQKNVMEVFNLVKEDKITVEEGSYLLNEMNRPKTFIDRVLWFFRALVS